MPDHLPPALIEACLVVGASSDNLSAVYQLATDSNGSLELPLLEPVALHVLTPPFVSREHVDGDVVRLRGHSCVKERESPLSSATTAPNTVAYTSYGGGERETSSVPKDIDLTALPQLCFPGGLQVTNEQKEEQFHFLVFTDVFGNQTYGVVMQCYRPILEGRPSLQNSMVSKLYSAYGFCVISKQPYYTALKDCLSCLLVQLRTCHQSDLKERVKKFAAHLALVPIPPPGQLHVMFHLDPLNIVVPAREERDKPAVDLDLHLPLLIFRPKQLLQVLSCLLQEQHVVLFSTDWARLTLIAECFLLFLQPLSWQQPYVPVLASGMLDFLMAPTAFLMGCHISHFEEVATETNELILINIDEGTISSSCFETGFETVNLPEIPQFAADCFKQRCQSLHLHYDLHQCHCGSYCDINEQRAERRAWQQNINREIQGITLELIVNIFSDVSCHLNYEHRVFNSVEFLNTRKPSEQLFYKKVLDTHIFHSFLKDRLNSKIDAFTCMDLNNLPEIQRVKSIKERPCRHTMLAVQARKNNMVAMERRLSKGQCMPDLREDLSVSYHRVVTSDSAFRTFPKPVKVLKLPDFPATLTVRSVKSYYNDVILLLNENISSVPPDNSALLARYYFLRGFINSLCFRRLEALSDFQSLYKTDTDIFPTKLVTWLVGSLTEEERQQADRRSELRGLLLKTENVKTLVQPDDHVKNFRLPRTHLHQDDFVRCIQESGIVKDSATIHRLFEALTDGGHMQVDPECFRDFYFFWKKTEAKTQDFSLPSEVIEHLDNSECVYKLSSCVRTSYGVGKIAMTQKRLFLLTEGRPGFQAITKFREIQEVNISSSSFLLLRSTSLCIRIASKMEVFEANLKTETDLWNLMVKEMMAGRKMADQHKDPQYVAQALTNVLLMDAVVGCLQHPSSPKAIWAASKLAYFDKVKHEELTTVSKTTAETLKHKIYPSQNLAEPQPVHLLLYMPGSLSSNEVQLDRTPKLWVALGRGMVVVFDAASWSMLQNSIKVGDAQLNCMLGLNQEQVWIGSQDSVIYIIDTCSMSCNKQLTEHRDEVTGIAVDSKDLQNSQDTFSCSCDGTILLWDATGLKVKRQLHLSCDRLSSIQIHGGTLWCCCGDGVVELTKNGTPQRKMALPSDVLSMPCSFSSFLLILEQGQLWTGCADSGELCLWHINDDCIRLFKRVLLPAASGVMCIIQVKDQVWAGCRGVSADSPLRGLVVVVDPQSLAVQKKLQAHSDSVQALCSAEDRYVLSGSARHDGKVAIWRV